MNESRMSDNEHVSMTNKNSYSIMMEHYFKQAFRLLKENKLLSVISIIGTALAICMIMVIVILYVVNTAGWQEQL